MFYTDPWQQQVGRAPSSALEHWPTEREEEVGRPVEAVDKAAEERAAAAAAAAVAVAAAVMATAAVGGTTVEVVV